MKTICRIAATIPLIIFSLLGGCGTCSRDLQPVDTKYFNDSDGTENRGRLELKYLGSGGILFRRGNDSILTAPFFSNPNIFRVGLLFPISSKTNLIEQLLPNVHDVEAILVGHSHYDHAMDLPYIAKYRAAPDATIYGNNTLSNILSATINRQRLFGLDSVSGEFRNQGLPGKWIRIPNQNVRFMALKSEHSPHFAGITFYKGEVRAPQAHLPCTAAGWKEGQTLAFLIDFLGPNDRIDYRILYHDSAVNCPPYGGMPNLPERERKKPDLCVLCMGAAGNVSNYPEGVISNTAPKFVIVAHWENFFKSQKKQVNCFEVVPFTNGKTFMSRLNAIFPKENTVLPKPGAFISIGN